MTNNIVTDQRHQRNGQRAAVAKFVDDEMFSLIAMRLALERRGNNGPDCRRIQTFFPTDNNVWQFGNSLPR